MAKKVYKTPRKYQCPFCDKKFTRMILIDHVANKHEELIPENYSAARVVYESINKTDHGTCMICKKPVYTWNEKTCRYNNLCDNPNCRKEVRRIALERHIKAYNVPTLLTNPEHQEKMLAGRHISGKYKYSDGTMFTYTGKYEKAALEFMDKVMNIPSKDIQMPGPILEYEYNGEKHSWITDIYYIPANLIIEVKDGGDNPNNRNMPEYRGKQAAKEVMITELGKFNYLRLTNNDFSQLLEALAEIKWENMDQKDSNKVNFFINESVLNEVKFENDKGASTTWIEPYMLNNTFDVSIGNDASDTVFIRDIDDNFKAITRKEFGGHDKPGEALVYKGDDATEVFENLSSTCKTFTEMLYKVAGYKFRVIDELAMMPNWYYWNGKENTMQLEMTTAGVIREYDILSGKIKVGIDKPIKGSVLLSMSDKGYFIHTPKDYYLSSDFYDSVEEIPQNVIDTMDDLYNQYKQRNGGDNNE